MDEAGGTGRLAGDAPIGILGEDRVQDRIGDLVADLVGMALGYGFGSKQIMAQDEILLH